MSGVVRAVLPLALTIIGGIVGGPIGASIGAFIGAAIVSAAFKPPGPEIAEQQAQTVGLDLGEVGREAIFGTALTGGSLGDAFNWGGKYGTDWEAQVILLADHRCAALRGFYVNDTYYAFAGNGPVTGFEGRLYLKWFDGSEGQAVGDDMANYGGYGPNDNLAGISYALVSYRADASDAENPIWPGGRPRFTFLVDGKHCYQARKDSTVAGGSGLHRWNDPSTYEWTDNPIDCRYNWARGIYACERVDQPGQLLVGRGLSGAEAPPERVAAAANLCDELVLLAGGGTEKRYRIGAVINALEQFDSIEGKFANACAGLLVQPEGSIEVEPGHAKAPVAYITDADLIVGKPVTFSDFRSEADEQWCNTVIPRYVEPTQRWADHGAPIRRNSADLIEDGGPREQTLPLGYVTSGTQAQRCGEIARRLGRLWRTGSCTLGPRFSELEEGDWIVWTSARRTKGLPVMFRIEAYALDEARQITLTLREVSATAYSWATSDEIAPGATAEAQTPPDGYGSPDVGTWALTGVSIGPGGATLPGLTFTGAVEDIYTSMVRFEYRVHNVANGPNDNWRDGGLSGADVARRSIVSVISNTAYDGAVSYVFPGGVPGPRLILGPVTTGSLAAGTHVFDDAAAPTGAAVGDIWAPAGLGILYVWDGADWVATSDVTSLNQIDVQVATLRNVPADYLGVVDPSLFPFSDTPSVTRGAVDIRTDAGTTYAITTSGMTATIDNASGSAAKGTISVAALSSNTSYYDLIVSIDGAARPAIRVTYAKILAGVPPLGGAGSKIVADAALNPLSTTSYAAVSDTMTLTLASGERLVGTAPLDYRVSGFAADYRVATLKWQYSPTGADTWTDFAAGITGSVARSRDGSDSEPILGHGDFNQAKSGLSAAAYDVRLVGLVDLTGRTVTMIGTATIEAKP